MPKTYYELNKQILHCRSELSKICPAVLVQSIHVKMQDVNSNPFNHLHQIKAQKLDQIGPQITSDSSPENLKSVVTIPENLPLSDSFIETQWIGGNKGASLGSVRVNV